MPYLTQIERNFDDKDVDSLIEHFRDPERREAFFKEYKEIEMLYEIEENGNRKTGTPYELKNILRRPNISTSLSTLDLPGLFPANYFDSALAITVGPAIDQYRIRGKASSK